MLRPRTTIRREGWFYLLIVAVVFGGAMFKEVNLLLILAGMLLGPVLLNWQTVGANLRGLHVARKLPRGLSAGDRLSVSLTLMNARRHLFSFAAVSGKASRTPCTAPLGFVRTRRNAMRACPPAVLVTAGTSLSVEAMACSSPRPCPISSMAGGHMDIYSQPSFRIAKGRQSRNPAGSDHV